jgi:hypothetical protein
MIAAYNCDCLNVIRVMESGIFTFEGELKGNLLTGSARNYISYPIIDLPLFILMASTIMVKDEWKSIEKNSYSIFSSTFDDASDIMIKLIFKSANYGLASWVNKLGKMKDEIDKLRKNLLAKPKLKSTGSRGSRAWPDRVDSIIALFDKLVPSAQGETIARNISLLFAKFDEDIKPKAITQRMWRMKNIEK